MLPLGDFLIKAVNTTNDLNQSHFSIRSYVSSPFAFLFLYTLSNKKYSCWKHRIFSNHTFKNNSMMHRFPFWLIKHPVFISPSEWTLHYRSLYFYLSFTPKLLTEHTTLGSISLFKWSHFSLFVLPFLTVAESLGHTLALWLASVTLALSDRGYGRMKKEKWKPSLGYMMSLRPTESKPN